MSEVNDITRKLELIEIKKKLKFLSICLVLVTALFCMFLTNLPEGQLGRILGLS